MRIIYSPALSNRGSDHFLVMDRLWFACLVRVDPDGSVEARVLPLDERLAFRRCFLREVKLGQSWYVEE